MLELVDDISQFVPCRVSVEERQKHVYLLIIQPQHTSIDENDDHARPIDGLPTYHYLD